jgi:hypothetical protein
MKTPRKILLEKHQAANAGLDAIRKQVLAAECRSEPQNPRLKTSRAMIIPLRVVLKLWGELIAPARRLWAGFAVVWLVIVVVNLAESDRSQPAEARAKPLSAGTMMALKEQQKILAELVGTTEPRGADKPKPAPPQPRSQRRGFWKIG